MKTISWEHLQFHVWRYNVASSTTNDMQPTTTPKTLAELQEERNRIQAELEQAEAAEREEAKRVAREAEAAERLEKRKAIYAQTSIVLNAIGVALDKSAHPYTITELTDEQIADRSFPVPGFDAGIAVSVEEYSPASMRWSKHAPRLMRVVVGPYGSRRAFQQLKTGKFNYDNIAAAIVELAASRAARIKVEQERRSRSEVNGEVVARLHEQFGLYTFGAVRVNADQHTTGAVSVSINFGVMTEEEAAALLTILKANHPNRFNL